MTNFKKKAQWPYSIVKAVIPWVPPLIGMIDLCSDVGLVCLNYADLFLSINRQSAGFPEE